ncbi:MAG: pyruvate kinase [Planctomycetaceae bacterium]
MSLAASEHRISKTKIIATVGPASESREKLKALVLAGVDVFRLNFAHGRYEWLNTLVESIRSISAELQQPVGILGDLSGPKIRLGVLPDDLFVCNLGATVEFVRGEQSTVPGQLTCTYEQLIDDVRTGDRILMADGTVSLKVVETNPAAGWVRCVVDGPGRVRSRQGVNLPGVALSTPALTEKDRGDLVWALEHELDFVGLSFVRSGKDIRELREAITAAKPKVTPLIVSKIEKLEAVDDLDAILNETDAVMVARGDLGVEVDIARVPVLQKKIIKACNLRRIPVITATQMLDSMQHNELPTRAEVTDIANAVLDGTDAVMLSGETAVGEYPVEAVSIMNRIACEAETLVESKQFRAHPGAELKAQALLVTEAVTRGAGSAAEHLNANIIAVASRSGLTAIALSNQRLSVPVIAVSDRPEITRRMCLFWGVTPVLTDTRTVGNPEPLLRYVVDWAKRCGVAHSGGRVVLIASTNWSDEGHDLMMVHMIS